MNMIAELRKAHGYSQADLGELMGVAQNTISNWEQGKREPDYASLKKLALFLDCSVDYLIGNLPIGRTFVFPESDGNELEKDNSTITAKRIKLRRKELGLGLQELADWTGLSKSTLQKYENSAILNISSGNLSALARELQTSPDWLCGWIDDVERKSPIDAYLQELLYDLGFNLMIYGDGKKINLGGPITLEEYQRFKDDITSYIVFQADKLAKCANERENKKIALDIKHFNEKICPEPKHKDADHLKEE